MNRLQATFVAMALFSQPIFATSEENTSAQRWMPYSQQVFEQAQAQDRLVLLDLVAVWCHWCHVMEATTYQDPSVRSAIAEHYLPVQVDHDARPDLAERYRDYGWPATIILTPDGRELVKRAGYIAPAEMVELLDQTYLKRSLGGAVAEERAEAESEVLSERLRERLRRRHATTYDHEEGGLQLMQKFLDPDSVAYDLQLAAQGDVSARRRALQTLHSAANLLDPEFGGAYQYSTHGDWLHPHYEKIARTQAAYLRIYSQAYAQFAEPQFLQVARRVGDYLIEFWQSTEGGFYNSQDADLQQGEKAHDYFLLPRAERLALGVPRIDRNRYASSNGLLIEGLVALYRASDEPRYLSAAVQAFGWTLQHRRRADGGFMHSASDTAGPFLADSLYMARAMLAMYEVSGQASWLRGTHQLADFIEQHFADPRGGLNTAVDNGTPVAPVPQIDQNIAVAQWLLRLAETDPAHSHQSLLSNVMRYLVSEPVATARLSDPGILMVEQRWRRLLDQYAEATSTLELTDVYL